ncbi:MAG: hypothetical protein U0441_36665 [Polyangiaceae bacterium]
MQKAFWMGCVAALALLGCGNKDGGSASGAPAMSGAPAGSGAAAASGKPAAGGNGGLVTAQNGGCAAISCGDRKGDFFEKCDCKGKNMAPPLVATYTGKMDSFSKEPLFDVENTSDRPIQWASAAVYYYDKSGKQISVELKDRKETFKKSTINGSNFTMKPKEKKQIHMGWSEKNAPKDVAKIEAVFDGWCYGIYDDKSTELCINIDRAPDDRPPSK